MDVTTKLQNEVNSIAERVEYVKDCIDTDDETEFSIQDIIHEILNNSLNVSE